MALFAVAFPLCDYTLAVALLGSLWPATALHALVDLGSGTMAWLALREGTASGEAPEGERSTELR